MMSKGLLLLKSIRKGSTTEGSNQGISGLGGLGDHLCLKLLGFLEE